MTVESFAEARTLAEKALKIRTETWGTEDAEAFRVYEVGTAEPGFVAGIEVPASPPWNRIGEPVILVDKATGGVRQGGFLSELERYAAMTPVGEGYPFVE